MADGVAGWLKALVDNFALSKYEFSINHLNERSIITFYVNAFLTAKPTWKCQIMLKLNSGITTGVGMSGFGLPTYVSYVEKFFYIWGVVPCIYIVTYFAHQQRKIVRTPYFFGAGDVTETKYKIVLTVFFILSTLKNSFNKYANDICASRWKCLC